MRISTIVLFVAACTPVLAQTQPIRFGGLTIQGSFRSRLELWDWFDGAANDSYAFSGNLLRVGLGQQRPRFDWQVEFALPVLAGLPDDAIAPAPQAQFGLGAAYFAANEFSGNAANLFPKQAYIRVKEVFAGGDLRFGRFEFLDGTEATPKNPTLAALKRDRISQRLLGNFGWSHVGRSFDGAHYVVNSGDLNVTVVGALPTRGVFQVNGWRNLETAVVYAAATRQVPGTRHNGEWRAMALYYDDWRDLVKTDNRALPFRNLDLFRNVRVATFGGHYLHTTETAAGPVDLLGWGVLQTGEWGSLNHRAGAFALEAGWQPDALPLLRPWIRAGYFLGSGDGDPADDTHGTFFQVLPTPRVYARFPFFNLMNIRDAFAEIIVRPHRAVSVRADVHSLRLSDRNDLWYMGGGAFQPNTFGYAGRPSGGVDGLGTLYDIGTDYQLDENLAVAGYFGYVNGGPALAAIYPQGENGAFGYLELLFRF